jgi:hypothetical protein
MREQFAPEQGQQGDHAIGGVGLGAFDRQAPARQVDVPPQQDRAASRAMTVLAGLVAVVAAGLSVR